MVPMTGESPCLHGSLNTIRKEKRENVVFIHFKFHSSEGHGANLELLL